MKYTIQKLFQHLGYKKSANAPSKSTAVGQYGNLMYENISSPSVTEDDACAWVIKHKQEIIKNILNGNYK